MESEKTPVFHTFIDNGMYITYIDRIWQFVVKKIKQKYLNGGK